MDSTSHELTTRWMSYEELTPFLELGDLLEFRRVVADRHHVYTHWAVYVGLVDNIHRVIHLSNGESDFGVDMENPAPMDSMKKLTNQSQVTVRRDDLEAVAGRDMCRINNSMDFALKPFPPSVIRQQAISCLGTGDYSILMNNCEHFAKWARYGSRESNQATYAKSVILGSTALMLTGSFTAGVAAAAFGYGLSYVATRMRRHFYYIPRFFR